MSLHEATTANKNKEHVFYLVLPSSRWERGKECLWHIPKASEIIDKCVPASLQQTGALSAVTFHPSVLPGHIFLTNPRDKYTWGLELTRECIKTWLRKPKPTATCPGSKLWQHSYPPSPHRMLPPLQGSASPSSSPSQPGISQWTS